MKAGDLKNPIDRAFAERAEKRHRVKTYKDRPFTNVFRHEILRDRGQWRGERRKRESR